MTTSDAFDIGAGLPGWLLRGVVALSGGGIVLVLETSGIGGPALVVAGIAALLSVALPASPAPSLMVLLVALAVLATEAGPFSAQVLLLIPLVHLMHTSCGIAGLVPISARVHLAALRAPAVRFVGIQAAVFAIAGVMALAPARRVPPVLEYGAIVGIAVIAVLIIRQVNRD
jgi:hypothetical protein